MFFKFVWLFVLLATQVFAADVYSSYHYEFGLNSTAYQQQFDQLLQQGYRLTYVSAHLDEHNQTALFSGVWRKTATSVPWVARHNLNGSQYDAFSISLKEQNYHPVVLNAYNLPNGESRFATIWEKASVGTWTQQRDMTEAQLKDKMSALKPLRITTLTRYIVGNQVLFAATWGQRTAEDWHGDWSYSVGKPTFDMGPYSDGYKPISLNVYSVNGDPVYDAVWQRYRAGGPGSDATALDIYDEENFESAFKMQASNGLGLRILAGYHYGDCIVYAATFEKDS